MFRHFLSFSILPLLFFGSIQRIKGAADSVIVFNEIHYHPADEVNDTEWLELRSLMGVDVDVSGWAIDRGVNFTFPEGTVIPGNGFVLLASDPGSASLSGKSVIGSFSGQLSNSGEELRLVNNNGRVMDRISYGDDNDWPVGADGTGATLTKRFESSAHGSSSNWVASPSLGGTPGEVNFPTSNQPSVTTNLIALGEEWRYRDTNSAPPADWHAADFDDSGWPAADATFYAGETEDTGAGVGLLGYWPLEESSGTSAPNAVAGGQTAQLMNGVSWTMDPTRGRVLSFDGVNDYVDAGSIPRQTNSSAFTWSFWAYDQQGASNNVIVGNRYGPTGSDFSPREFIKFTTNQFEWHRNGGAGGNIDYAPMTQSAWIHHAVVKEGTSLTYYRNGVVAGSSSITGGLNNAQPFYFGGDQANENWQGRLDDPAIWEVALPPSAIAGLADGTYNPLSAPTVGGGGGGGNLETELAEDAGTHYFRKSFAYGGNPVRTNLTLQLLVDDGAVVYLNGEEVHRENQAAGADAHGSHAESDIDPALISGGIPISSSSLIQGDNFLAIRVHQSSEDSDMLFDATLSATEMPPDPSSFETNLVFSEITSASDPQFRVELTNLGASPLDLAGYVVATTSGSIYTIPSGNLTPGSQLVLGSGTLGFTPLDGDRISILRPGQTELADSRVVTNSLRGLDASGRWSYPSAPSFGGPNTFTVEQDVVINEIMYHPRPFRGEQTAGVTLLDWDATWRYNEAALDLGNDWELFAHPVGGNWMSGPGPIGHETAALPVPLNTSIQRPVGKAVYFETEFDLSAAQLAEIEVFQMSHQIDDGAIFYLNGVEIERFKMNAEPTTFESFANDGGDAVLVTGVEIPASLFVVGSNRLSVEVHQNTIGSSDVVFGLKLEGAPEFVAFEKSDDQWIELHNHGDSDVDISGWEFTDGISFMFPDNTMLAAGEYLLVARDAAAISALYPGVTVFGDWGGNLSRSGERLTLRDGSKRIVDEVRFFDDGRWSSKTDGGGASLELIDPQADNSVAESWAPSDEGSRSSWQTYSYQASGANHGNDPTTYREFLFGLLDNGEFLIDDISVVENPDGAATQLIQNGDFSSGDSNSWRLIGTHRHAEVIDDPDGGGNKVLHMRTTGSTEHQHNNAGTTLKSGDSFVAINSGSTYEISFRAKWLSGSNQLHTRLYFNRAARTTHLSTPDGGGTPGAANSRLVANAGPTLDGLIHEPAVPAANESCNVKVEASDPDGVSSLTLFYSVNGAPFSSSPMVESGSGQWSGIVPGQSAASKVQFYLEAEDDNGAVSWLPADGPDSRAIIPIADGQADLDFGDCQPNNFRIVMTDEDRDFMHTVTNVMSNDRLGCTVIWNERDIFYNCGVRLKGSQRGRAKDVRVGFNVRFPADQLFLGAHKTVAIDRSGSGDQFSQKEILVKHAINHAGRGIPGMEDDLIRVIAPKSQHTSSAMLLKSRYDSEWMDNMYENGSDGTAWEFELIYYPTSTVGGDPEGLKFPNPDSIAGVGAGSLGSDPELYRWHWLIKNNRDADNYAPLVEMLGAYGQGASPTYLENMDRLLDVDQFLRSFAVQILFGIGDNYSSGSNHNGMFYQRPEDGKFLLFPWDMDFAFSRGATSSLTPSGDLNKLLSSPANERAYFGHIKDIIDTSYNSSYMSPWATHYSCFLPTENLAGFISYINTRSSYALGQIDSRIPQVSFGVSTANGSTSASDFTIEGEGWVDVREIRLAGSDQPLDVTWTSTDSWEVSVALASGINTITLEGYDFAGNLVGFDTVTITSTGTVTLPSVDSLVVSEIYYNPSGASEGSEYLEFLNIHETDTLNLTGLRISEGVSFTFPAGSTLAPGERILVVSNLIEFEERFGPGLPVAGEFESQLSNGGEVITIRLADGSLVRSFSYSDDEPWPLAADGEGASLVLAVPTCAPNHSLPESWRASLGEGGSPGTSEEVDYLAWKTSFGNPADDADPDGDGWSILEEFMRGGSPTGRDHLGAQSNFATGSGVISLSSTIRAGANVKVILESSADLDVWTADPDAAFQGSERLTQGGEVVDLIRYTTSMSEGRRFYRFSLELVDD